MVSVKMTCLRLLSPGANMQGTNLSIPLKIAFPVRILTPIWNKTRKAKINNPCPCFFFSSSHSNLEELKRTWSIGSDRKTIEGVLLMILQQTYRENRSSSQIEECIKLCKHSVHHPRARLNEYLYSLNISYQMSLLSHGEKEETGGRKHTKQKT